MSFRMSTRVTATVCCILMQILYVVSQNLQLLGDEGTSSPCPSDLLPGLCPWTPLESPDPQSSFMSPNNPVRSTSYVCFSSKVVDFNPPHLHFFAPVQGDPVRILCDLWHHKARVSGLSCGMICVILCLAILIQYRSVTTDVDSI